MSTVHRNEDGAYAQVNTGDSISWTSLSICTNIATVISKSALTEKSSVTGHQSPWTRTIWKVGSMHVRKLVPGDITRRLRRRCDTTTDTASRTELVRLAGPKP